MSTIDLDDAKKLVKEECKNWEQAELVEAVHELIEMVPGLRLEQWMSRQLRDKDGNSPTIIGHG